MTIEQVEYSGGFPDPVFGAQATFRSVLEALSRPGRIVTLQPQCAPPAPLSAESADVVAALADEETPVYISPARVDMEVALRWVQFHTGAPLTATPGEAGFSLVPDIRSLPSLTQFALGSDEYPDRSTTLVIQLDALEGGRVQVALTGPGVKDEQIFAPKGLSVGFWQQAIANHELYPRGIDILFVAPGVIAGVPRSTSIEIRKD